MTNVVSCRRCTGTRTVAHVDDEVEHVLHALPLLERVVLGQALVDYQDLLLEVVVVEVVVEVEELVEVLVLPA